MKSLKKLFGVLLSFTLVFGTAAGCVNSVPNPDPPDPGPDVPPSPPTEEYYEYDYDAKHESSDRMLRFYSSDSGLDAFLNDYRERHMRDTEDRIHTHPVGAGSSAWKEWESMIGSWWDASPVNGTMSEFYSTKKWVTDWLKSPRQDKQGYVWADEGNAVDSWGMGWQFPSYKDGGQGWIFDTEGDTEGWSANSGVRLNVSGSLLRAETSSAVSKIELTSPVFNCSTTSMPFLQMNFAYNGKDSAFIDDLYVYYKTDKSEDEWSEDRKAAFSDFCTTGFEIGENDVNRQGFFFPMYLLKDWGWNNETSITQLKLVLQSESSKTFQGTISFDYITSDYDDRQALNPCNYIIAAKEICEFSQDEALLAQILPNARKAMNFLLEPLQGKNGLISTQYLVGHENDGLKGFGMGIGNGYWDVLAFPTVNLYCNISYYNALKAMSYLEGMAEHYNVSVPQVLTVGTDMKSSVVYGETSESLQSLSEKCKQSIQTTFWNEKTGRFHVGVRDFYEEIQDHGYLMFNEQVLASGIATEEQAKSVMQWINGERTVESDDSKGADIYYYEFAPRFNTAEIGSDFTWQYSAMFNGNVQNGGTALQLAYYDLVAQASVDKNASYNRLKNTQKWYEKVKAAGGKGWDFYHKYYDNYTNIGIQGGPSSGTIGVDYEFLEAALLFVAVPDAYFGLDTRCDNTLVLTPALPDAMKFWKMENLTFSGYYYDVSVGQYFVQVSGVNDYTEGSGSKDAALEIRMREPSFNYEVYLNGNKTTDYRTENGKIVLNVGFGNVKTEIKKV